MKYVIVIPARYESTRLPGKPLLDINGKTLIQRTYEQCIKAVPRELVYVATDNNQIFSHCTDLGIQVRMTSANCLTGTDRVSDFAEQVDADVYINVQGDEPLMNPTDIETIIHAAMKYPGDN